MTHGPLILAIEASSPSSVAGGASSVGAGVALGRSDDPDADVLGVEPMDPAPGADDPARAIARLLSRTSTKLREVETLAVSVGPGGYTALRVAVTVAKLIAEAIGARCAPVATSDALVRRVPAEFAGSAEVHVALAWKRSDLWLASYAPGGRSPSDQRLVSLEQAGDLVAGGVLVADPRLVARIPALEATTRTFAPVFDPVAVLEAARSAPIVDPARLAPLYPRRPEAVSKWESLHGSRPQR